MHDITTLAEIAVRCGVTVRTVQRHASENDIGQSVGGTRILTTAEADRLCEIVRAARPGRPAKR